MRIPRILSRRAGPSFQPTALAALSLFFCVIGVPKTVGAGVELPGPLKGWESWALHGKERELCPRAHDGSAWSRCAYPARLELTIDKDGGRFEQVWTVYAAQRVALPGDERTWPQEVQVDGKPAVVTQADGRPHVRLAVGTHRISGGFSWSELPQAVTVPADSGLVALSLGGRDVAEPRLEGDRLFLQTTAASPVATDSLEVRIHRRVVDDIPMFLETRIDLTVAGKSREIQLPRLLPDGFIPMSLSAPIPVRLDGAGVMTLQGRPGKWTVTLVAHHPQAVADLARPAATEPLPEEEVWVFVARENLRLVNVEGVTAIDPSQTTLPDEWKSLPAFHMPAGAVMRFADKRRGNPEPPPDQISLRRTVWLDFDGGGYAVRDFLQGTVTRSWRVEMPAPAALGRVEVNGESQLITRGATGEAGVELTRGELSLKADSRITGGVRRISAAGWNLDPSSLSMRLELPPGWRMLAVRGADASAGTWIRTWNLLNLFVLLLVSVAIAKLRGPVAGAVMLAALILVLPEGAAAPRYIWLAVLPAVALAGTRLPRLFERLVLTYRVAATLVLAAIAGLFCLREFRLALYPVLEVPYATLGEAVIDEPEPESTVGRAGPADDLDRDGEEPAAEEPVQLEDEGGANSKSGLSNLIPGDRAAPPGSPEPQYKLAGKDQNYRMKNLQQRDPKANIQTGPGLPQWAWNTVNLTWNGPVRRDQPLDLLLMPPALTRTVGVLRGLLTVAAVLILILPPDRRRWRDWWRQVQAKLRRPGSAAAKAAILTLVGAGLLAGSGRGQAQVPPPEMIELLAKRLTEPPDCLPGCASMPRLDLTAEGGRLVIRAAVHAGAPVAVPLPGNGRHWNPDTVMVDGAPATAMMRAEDQTLWLVVEPGVHQITMAGRLAGRDSIQIALPLKPGQTVFKGTGWEVDGLHENGLTDASLSLSRSGGGGTPEGQQEVSVALPPLLRVERTLSAGLDWLVETKVTRLSGTGSGASIKLPLLPGERITTPEVRVVGDHALVTLGPQETEKIVEGALSPVGELVFKAPAETTWTEWWTVETSPIWHLEFEGIPLISQVGEDGQRRPHWRPWPGESVTLRISRPDGVEGSTATMDRSEVTVTPGLRSSAVELKVRMRASLGSDLVVKMPPRSEFQSIAIDGRAATFQPVDNRLTVPLHPGTQTVTVVWRDAAGISLLFRPPVFDLGLASVNHTVRVQMPRDRWTLWFTGPGVGPALLFWSRVAMIMVLALLLGRSGLTPLRTWQWALMGLGLTQTSLFGAGVVVGFLLLASWRERSPELRRAWLFNLRQLLLAGLALAAAVTLVDALRTGFFGAPQMQIAGNGSHAYSLNWFVDRIGAVPPVPVVVSVPMLAYQAAMLAWALWLALTLVRLARWFFDAMGKGGFWLQMGLPHLISKAQPRTPPPADGPPPA